jgi:hypothetical protein
MRSVRSHHSFFSMQTSRAASASESADAFKGSSLCAFTLTKNVAAPFCTLIIKFQKLYYLLEYVRVRGEVCGNTRPCLTYATVF